MMTMTKWFRCCPYLMTIMRRRWAKHGSLVKHEMWVFIDETGRKSKWVVFLRIVICLSEAISNATAPILVWLCPPPGMQRTFCTTPAVTSSTNRKATEFDNGLCGQKWRDDLWTSCNFSAVILTFKFGRCFVSSYQLGLPECTFRVSEQVIG